jgi:hypothetical protein
MSLKCTFRQDSSRFTSYAWDIHTCFSVACNYIPHDLTQWMEQQHVQFIKKERLRTFSVQLWDSLGTEGPHPHQNYKSQCTMSFLQLPAQQSTSCHPLQLLKFYYNDKKHKIRAWLTNTYTLKCFWPHWKWYDEFFKDETYVNKKFIFWFLWVI